MKAEWQIAGQAFYCAGSYSSGGNNEWKKIDSIQDFYKETLKKTTVKIQKSEKFFRIGKESAITILMAILALEECSFRNEISFDTTAILGFGKKGSHQGNLDYWKDYADNGRQGAQGHLFVGTLASTPLCQLALTLGCHAPVYYVSPENGYDPIENELEFLSGECKDLFLIELDTELCKCMLLHRNEKGFPAEKIIQIQEKALCGYC